MPSRSTTLKRETKETQIDLGLNLDGTGVAEVETGIPFLDHMLDLLAKHALFDIKLKASGDLDVDTHHTVEDIGICLGQALAEALGDKSGIRRYGHAVVPMDESLALVAVDISGRSHLVYDVRMPVELIGTFDTALTIDFLHALVNRGALTLHVKMLSGRNAHHMIEAIFKGLARALRSATEPDARMSGVPSTKGTL